MFSFFYDSLDTLKKVKVPSRNDALQLTWIIFIVVIIAALIFAFMDGIFGEVYNMIYDALSGGISAPAIGGVGEALPWVEFAPEAIDVAPVEGAEVVPTEIEVAPVEGVAE